MKSLFLNPCPPLPIGVASRLLAALLISVWLPFSLAAQRHAGTVVAWGTNTLGQSSVPSGLNGVVGIAAGYLHSLALQQDGRVVAWGFNSDGQSSVPDGLTGVVGIAAGGWHSLALKQDGTVVAWGRNSSGQASVPRSLSRVIGIAAGIDHNLALKQDGTVVAWGDNYYGQRNVPSGLNGVVGIAAGGSHSLALKQDGTVVAWGSNGSGQTNVPNGLNGVVGIAAGQYHSLALKQDGTVVAWGGNDLGQSSVPSGLSGVVATAGGYVHSLALKQDGTVAAWGYFGQSCVPDGLGGVLAISAGYNHSLAVVFAGPLAPTILAPPRTQTAESGSVARFYVWAQGFPFSPLHYQWFFNGGVCGDKSFLELPGVQPSHAGAYTVVITNCYGAVTSSPAMLSVIPAVERRSVPALALTAPPSSSLSIDFTHSLESPAWTPLSTVTLTASPQFYFDLTSPLPPQRFYRAFAQRTAPGLDLHMAPAITLTGAIGNSVRVDYINQFGPTDAWVNLATVTLTNSSQLYFDTSAIDQPPRLYRLSTP